MAMLTKKECGEGFWIALLGRQHPTEIWTEEVELTNSGSDILNPPHVGELLDSSQAHCTWEFWYSRGSQKFGIIRFGRLFWPKFTCTRGWRSSETLT